MLLTLLLALFPSLWYKSISCDNFISIDCICCIIILINDWRGHSECFEEPGQLVAWEISFILSENVFQGMGGVSPMLQSLCFMHAQGSA